MTTPYSIRISLLAMLALCSAGALAQSRAVETRNYQFGVSSVDSDTPDSTSNGTLGVNLGATLPLGSLFGISLSGFYSSTKVRTGDVLPDDDDNASAGSRPSCSFDNNGGDVAVFVRWPSLGRLAASYGVGRVSPDCGDSSVFIATGEDKLKSDNYRIDAEVYLGDFTLGAARISTELEDGPKLESNSVAASWYPLDSLKLSLTGSDLYDQDTYGFMVEHQPEFLGDAFGINVGYSRSDQSPQTRTIFLGMKYYFGTHVTLQARDRQYR